MQWSDNGCPRLPLWRFSWCSSPREYPVLPDSPQYRAKTPACWQGRQVIWYVTPVSQADMRQPSQVTEYNSAETGPRYYHSSSGKKYIHKWNFLNTHEPSQRQIKTIVALVFKYMMKQVFSGHVYLFKGKIYLQTKGGPIGLEMSGSIARLVLLWFDKTLLQILKANNIKIYMYKRFIDDIDGALSKIKPGYIYNKSTQRLEFSPDQEQEDRDKSPSLKTMEIVREIADSITSMLKWELDISEFHQDGCLPMLDLKI